MIEKIIIHNYKLFKDFQLELENDLNIIVGDNESGKSTILEAINLALTKKLNGKFIEYELTPFLFNSEINQTFITELQNKRNPELPNIFIELYLTENNETTFMRGSNNSQNEDAVGIRLEIIFNEDFKEDYEELIASEEPVELIPTEFYKVNWYSFGEKTLTPRGLPIKTSFIDSTSIRLQSGTDYYLQTIIHNGLDVKERVSLNVEFRKLKERFAREASIKEINKKINIDKGMITDKELAIAIDVSQKSNWEANLIPHLDRIPFQYSGQGEQSSLKIMLALNRDAEETNIILIEEPENHLSFSSMNILLNRITESSSGKQVILTTHSSFVLNKLGLSKLVLISDNVAIRLANLSPETQIYFKRLSGYDTLRLILAKKAILVEGPSDELIVQKTYLMKNRKMPIEDGIDVINVRGLSFKRFLDIAKLLKIQVSVVTDNDGNYEEKIIKKYQEFEDDDNISIYSDSDENAPTLENQIAKYNELKTVNVIFKKDFKEKSESINFMKKDKVGSALAIFETSQDIQIPGYIHEAIE